jgi:prephenate dehydrogenase
VTLYGRNIDRLQQTAKEIGVHSISDLRLAVQASQVIFVSVPIPETIPVIKSIIPFLLPDSLIIEVTSIKSGIIPALRNIIEEGATSIHFLSLHPMFGGGAPSLKGRKILFVTFNDDRFGFELLWDSFAQHEALCLETSFKEHDAMMAKVLSCSHFVNLAFLELIRQDFTSIEDVTEDKIQVSLDQLIKIGGTTFGLQKTIAEAVLQEKPEIYGPIQMENPYFLQHLKNFRSFLDEYITMIQNKDQMAFSEFFEGLRKFAKSDIKFEKAYEIFYEFVKHL